MTGQESVSSSIAGHILESAWRLEGARAVSNRGDAAIELARPQDGIAVAEHRAVQNSGRIRLLGLSLGGNAVQRGSDPPFPGIAPSDTWTRGLDLVAAYEPHDPRFLRATAMWRHLPSGSDAVLAWELVASAQTSLLESDASIAAISVLPAREMLVLDDGSGQWHPADVSATTRVSGTAVLVRCDGDRSVLMTVHPADARRVIVGPDESSATAFRDELGLEYGVRVRIECWLFPNAVEKGVLLRGRSLAAIGPTDGDLAWAERLLGRFRGSPPVLTT